MGAILKSIFKSINYKRLRACTIFITIVLAIVLVFESGPISYSIENVVEKAVRTAYSELTLKAYAIDSVSSYKAKKNIIDQYKEIHKVVGMIMGDTIFKGASEK